MGQLSKRPAHPGTFIRDNVIPSDMSVTDAAKILGVGRPALSNLLNGRSSLSAEMAMRLETAFGADRRELLDRQMMFDCSDPGAEERAATAVSAYVPDFLTIKANQIAAWADHNLEARQLLPVLLRKLIHSTGRELRRVDFPGYDNAERRGWDGTVEAGAATPWIPEGDSGWEFGTDQNPWRKAENDYAARVKSVPEAERAERSFVFVTPRNWSRKEEWVSGKRATGNWKAVRAFDASDLEQWLEQSIPARMWFAEKIGMSIDGFETLDWCWQRWAEGSEPKMTPAMFETSIITHRSTFRTWLDKPSERPLVIAADSRDEALAFLSCLFQEEGGTSKSQDLAAVFGSVATLRKLVASSARFIPIVYTEEAERELVTVYRRLHCIAIRHRNIVDSKPDIALDRLNLDAFEKALTEMGIKNDAVDRLARESGRSPTILRRRLSCIHAIKTPQWVSNETIARNLIPMTLVGAWNGKSKADQEVVSSWSNGSYQQIEESITQLLQLDDCPVWATGQYRGVASKVDALFAINRYVTENDLTVFFSLAKRMLSEVDPALDLPEGERWAAELYGKVRNYSPALREAICETLVVLSVHGNALFGNRLNIDVEDRVSSLIRSLLTPLTLDKLLSYDKDLPHYAEAAPHEFLNMLEADLRQSQPAVLGLLKPADGGPLGRGYLRSGLLWALECLAWEHLGRVSPILAQLSETVINDNWANKPIASLGGIFRSWMPQTAASLEDRMQALKMLTERFPDIGWQICITLLNTGPQMAIPAYRPRWRSNTSGAGQSAMLTEINESIRKALDLVLAWPVQDQRTLGDLVEHLRWIPDEDQNSVWNLIDAWADAEADDNAKADLRERIRRFAFTRRGCRRNLNDATRDRAHEAYEKLRPNDPVVRHAWLFASQWIHESADEFEAEDLDHSERAERIRGLRASAMKEIWSEHGLNGVMTLLSDSRAPHVVGYALGQNITDEKIRGVILRQCLSIVGELENKIDGCIGGFLSSGGGEVCDEVLSIATEGADIDRIVRLFRCAPFGQDTWRLLDRYDKAIRDRYWQTVPSPWNRYSDAELLEIVERLLEAKRPRTAFHAVCRDWPRIETSRLKRLLLAVATVDAGSTDHDRIEAYYVSTALASLDGRTGVTPDEMAQFEFMYIETLEHSEHGIPNLERWVTESPIGFVQALALISKRCDGGQDPQEWQAENPEQRTGLAAAAYRLLRKICRIPGTGMDGKINTEALCAWIAEVQRLCVKHGREKIGNEMIGQLLSRAPSEDGGFWPCLPVCEAMERASSPYIGAGFRSGVRIGRGWISRAIGEGGAQERVLAAKYRTWAAKRAIDYPYIGSVLENIATDYDREGRRHDDEADVDQRLQH